MLIFLSTVRSFYFLTGEFLEIFLSLHNLFFAGLFEERAILFGKLGQHEKALAIYVTVLGDTAKAIQYCENVYNRGGVGSDMVNNFDFIERISRTCR